MAMVEAAVFSWLLAGVVGLIAYGGAVAVAGVVLPKVRDREDPQSLMTAREVRQRVGDALLMPAAGTYMVAFMARVVVTNCRISASEEWTCGVSGLQGWGVLLAFVALLVAGMFIGAWLLEHLVLAQTYGYVRRALTWWVVWIGVDVLADRPMTALSLLAGIAGGTVLAALCAAIPPIYSRQS